MPRVITPQQKREKAFIVAVARHAAELELMHDKEIAEYLGIRPDVYCNYKKEHFRNMSYERRELFARRLGFTGREWCETAGIPYERKEGDENG